MQDSCLILDGFSLIFRSFFGMPARIRTTEGQPINAVLGFYNSLQRLINQIQPTYVVAAFDYPEPTFRHAMYPEYKANRPPMPEDLKSQLPLIRRILRTGGIPILEMPGFEADDVMGTVSRILPSSTEAYIVTSDRDALQLVNSQVTVLVPDRRENRIYTPQTVAAEWGVSPSQIPDLKALMGDASDNIPGVPLVGRKTAVRWLTHYQDLDALLHQASELRGKAGENLRRFHDSARLYRQLATIRCSAPILWCWQSCRLALDTDALRATLDQIGIRARLPESQTGS